MAKISTYPILSTPSLNDLLIGTDVENLNITKNFAIGDIASFIIGGSYVPYVGATGNVNLGAFNITSGGFIVNSGTAAQFLKANGTLDSTVYQPAGNYITQLSGEATASGPGNAAVTLSNAAVIGKVLTGLTITGNAIVATDSILTAFGKVQNQINTLVGGVQYKGTWNAATNTPALVSSVGVSGNYYVVSVAGNTNLNGITDWNLGDWAIFNGSAWEKVDNTDAVISVNGQVGAVVLTTTNIAEGTNLYYTNTRARLAINLTTTGNSGAATYNNTNGFFNIPEYTLAGLGGVPLTRQITINGVAQDLSADRTYNVGTVTSIATTGPLTGGTITGSGTIGITQSSTSTDGYLSSTDWTTFNNKQNTIVNPVTGTGTAFSLPMWSGASSLVNSPLSYLSDTFTFQYNTPTGGTLSFTNSNGTAYTYTIQMNNFGSPRSTVHSYTDGIVVQSIGGVQVSRVFANGNTVFGTGVADNGHKLEITGDLYVSSIANAVTDTDRFLVSDAGVIKYRTGTELRSDIGAGVGSVTSVGLTMPSAFSVANSPITSAGTIAVTGAGNASQYVRGDGTLADFPTSTGGGASVSYYLNGSVNQGTIGGVDYKELSEVPIFGAGTDISIAADGYIASFITDAGDPNLLNIPAGNWNFETYFSASSGGGTPTFYVELYRYDGTTFTLIASSVGVPELISFGTNIQPYFSTLAVPQTALAATDRLAVRYYVNVSGRTITLHTENVHLCQIVTTFSNGLTALNGLTAQVQYFMVGTAGTDFNIASASATHTFNIPDASATARGLVTAGMQTIAGLKTFSTAAIFLDLIYADGGVRLPVVGTSSQTFLQNINSVGLVPFGSNHLGFNTNNNLYFASDNKGYAVFDFNNAGTGRTYTLPNSSGTIALVGGAGVGTVTSVAALTLGTSGTDLSSTVANGTTTPVITLNVPDASATARGVVTTGTQRIAGTKTFDSGIKLTNGSSTAIIYSQSGTNTNTYQFPTSSGFLTTTSSEISSGIAKFNTGNQLLTAVAGTDYVVPSALSAYLPLAGGTLTGPLNGTSATFTGDLIAASATINTPSNAVGVLVNGRTSDNFSQIRFGANTGGGAYNTIQASPTSFDIISQGNTPITFGTNLGGGGGTRMTILGTGGVTLTGALNGTSASFTGDVTASSNAFFGTFNGNDKYHFEPFTNAAGGANNAYFVSGKIDNNERSGFVFQARNSNGEEYNAIIVEGHNSTSTTTPLSIASTGAATFSSSVTAQVNNISADGAGVVLQGYSDNNLRIAVRGSGYNDGGRGGLLASTGDFSSSVGIGTTPVSGVALDIRNNSTTTIADMRNSNSAGFGPYIAAASGSNYSLRIADYQNNTLFSVFGSGAATFSSSVTATGAGTFQGPNDGTALFINRAGGASVLALNTNTNGSFTLFDFGAGTFTAGITQKSGNVGIGISTGIESKLTVSSSTKGIGLNESNLQIQSNESLAANIGGSLGFGATSDYGIVTLAKVGGYRENATGTSVSSYLSFETRSGTGGNIERMRITSGGQMLVGISDVNSSAISGFVSGFNGIGSKVSNNAFYLFSGLNSSNTTTFFVLGTGDVQNTNNSYGAISDIKLKENIEDATPKLDDLMKVKVRNYNLIGDDKKQIGVIAQELEEVFPAMIDESEDYEEVEVPQLDEEGNEVLNQEGEVVTTKERVSKGTTTKSVKYSVFVPMLIKAIQELKTEIDSLKNQIK